MLPNNMHSVGLTLADAWSDFLYISWWIIIKLIRSKSPFLWYSFFFNVVVTHEIITFQDICIDEIPKDFTSIKDPYYTALTRIAFISVAHQEAPYVMKREVDKGVDPESLGNALYEGFCIDLLQEIAQTIGFKYKIVPTADGEYGSKDEKTGKWNGLVRDLVDRVWTQVSFFFLVHKELNIQTWTFSSINPCQETSLYTLVLEMITYLSLSFPYFSNNTLQFGCFQTIPSKKAYIFESSY